MKFFLKRELFYIPIIGFAWWVLDFPFMSRHSRETLRKKPHLIGEDINTTRKSCEKFKNRPVAIVNFIEGTRFTAAKYAEQKSPYRNLLKPKSGGIAFVLKALDGKINKILNLTIKYKKPTSFWNFLCGDLKKIVLDVETIKVTDDYIGNYQQDESFKIRFQNIISDIWKSKDQTFDEINV